MRFHLLLLSTAFIATGASAAECTIAKLKQDNPRFCEPVRRPQPMTERQMKELFLEVRQIQLDFILKGRKPEQLTAEEDSLYQRISRVEFGGFEDCGRGDHSDIDAYFQRSTHKVFFCGGTKNLPAPALVAMIGHEIGHSGDSCSSQAYFVSAGDRSRLKLPAGHGFDQAMTDLLSGGTGPIQSTLPITAQTSRIVEGWRESGVATVHAEPIPLNRYPLNPTRMCLIQQERIWRSTTPGPVARDPNKDPGCADTTDFECMADVWGAHALGKYFEKHPEIRGGAALAMFESRKNQLCSRKPYQETNQRIDAIWLAAPGVAEALGCTPAESHRCLKQHPPFPAGRGDGASPESNPGNETGGER